MHANLAKMTARHAGTCQDSPCPTRIAVGDAIYFSRDKGVFCAACGEREAKARSAWALDRKAENKRRREAKTSHERMLSHVRRHGTLPEWWIATRSSRNEAMCWLDRMAREAATAGELVPCACDMCK